MNKHLRYSLLVVLAFALTISLVKAAPIGQSLQARPYESNPTAYSRSATTLTVSSEASMWDGDLGSSGSFKTPTTTTPAFYWFQLQTFRNSPPEAFSIAWVDFKMKYTVPAFTNDKLRIEYQVAPSTAWTILQPEQTGAATKFNRDGIAVVRPWTNLVEPNNGVWEWADIANFKVRFYMTLATPWDGKTVYVNEAWLTVYETAPPTTGSPTVSLVPNTVLGLGQYQDFFVDIYVRDVASLWGYQFYIYYDTNVLTATDYFSYNIFDTAAPSWIDDTLGEVEIAYTSYGGDLVGFSGNMPLARVYFMVDGGGASKIWIDTTKQGTGLAEAGTGASIAYTANDGWYSGNIIMSFNGGLLPLGPPPIGSQWHELYPHYSNMYTLSSWIDNGDSDLSASDQIDMTNETGWLYWYHVDVVTTTIHFTFKDPDTGLGGAEPETPTREWTEITDPVGSRWHQIHGQPTPGTTDTGYCRMFTITSWIDNGNGVFDSSDQFDFQYDDEYVDPPEVWPTHWAHLDAVTTDIILSQKGEPEPGVPEFPLGIGLIFAVAPMIALVYLWRTKPVKKVK
jgi:hypothetical protein